MNNDTQDVLGPVEKDRGQGLLVTDDDCVHCPSAVRYAWGDNDPTAAERRELFHQPCYQCSLSEIQNENMCPTCQHLRLRHLIACVPAETRGRLYLYLRIDLVEEVGITRCPLCRIVKRMVLDIFQQGRVSRIVKTWYSLGFHLRSSQEQPSSIITAEIHLTYADKSPTDVGTVWVGNLRIDDIDNVANLPSVGAMFSWERLEPSMTECAERHAECRQGVQRILPSGFRVIDIARRCIVEDVNAPFVALSYVWGKDTRLSLLTATRDAISGMKREGGLPREGMPRTIEDAMSIATRLGESYLWVDRLCIIQDNPEDKSKQVEVMNDIFSSARLVLVAAYGNSMHFGIHGISRPRRLAQYHEDLSTFRVTNVVREPEDDPFALWHTRGWTYQEAVLARRLLYFTNVQAFFQCRRLTCHEDAYHSETERDKLTSYELAAEIDNSQFRAFARHLEEYTSRRLSYQSDVYNGITGIMKALYGRDSVFIEGLPQVDFDRALLWFCETGKTSGRFIGTEEKSCPTWSWSAIINHSDRAMYRETAQYGTFVPWYKRADGSSPVNGQLETVNLHSETEMDEDWGLYMAIACEIGLMGSIPITWSLKTDSFSAIRERFSAAWPDYHTFCTKALQSIYSPEWCQKTNSFMPAMKKGVLMTITQSGFLRLKERTREYGLSLIDSEGDIVGRLCGDAARLHSEVTSPHYDKNAWHEFIALSLSGHTGFEEKDPKEYLDVDGTRLDSLLVVNLLMVGRRGLYTHRRELGWVYLKDWAKIHREWKMIMLE